MNYRFIFTNKPINFVAIAASLLFATSCSGSGNIRPNNDSCISDRPAIVDTVSEEVRTPRPGDSDYRFPDSQALREYIDTCDGASRYTGGILPVIAREVPEYAEKLIASKFDRFIVVDKASMRVILYDRFGNVEKSYDMACAKNYGTKHKKADSRTPEGFFEVEGRYNSTEWLYTDDDGVTSQKKGQFGPRFIRLKIPVTSQIGIHGTCSPWSIGHRTSHGCIRITNENILELIELVEPGMPVIVLPGKRDRAVNREEGYFVPYFPTDSKYAMSEAEKKLPYSDPKPQQDKTAKKVLADSLENSGRLAPDCRMSTDDNCGVHPDSLSGKAAHPTDSI